MIKPVLFYSTNLRADPVCFSDALLKGIAPDGGLYMPEFIPQISNDTIREFTGKEYFQIAFEIIKPYLAGQIEEEELLRLVKDAYNFDVPLEKVYERK